MSKKKKTNQAQKYLKKISLLSPPKVLFLGNGINRLFQNSVSLDNLMEQLGSKSVQNLNTLPFYLQIQFLRHYNKKDSSQKQDPTKIDYSAAIKKLCLNWCTEEVSKTKSDFIKSLVENEYDSVISTNYSYEIEKSLNSDLNQISEKDTFICKKDSVESKSCDRTYFFHRYRHYSKSVKQIKDKEKMLYCYISPKDDGKRLPEQRTTPYVWHIHGEAEKYNDIVLDLHSYGKNMSVIQDFINKFIGRVMGALGAKNTITELAPKSWIDYFLLGNVNIVGFSLDYAEFDLWWLLDERRKVILHLKDRIKKMFNLKNDKNVEKYITFGKVTFWETILEDKTDKVDSKEKIKELLLKKLILETFGCDFHLVPEHDEKNEDSIISGTHSDNGQINITSKSVDDRIVSEKNFAVYKELLDSLRFK